jgi:hypothetical protein
MLLLKMQRLFLGLGVIGWIMSSDFGNYPASAEGLAFAVPPELQFMPNDVSAVLLVRPAGSTKSKGDQGDLGRRGRECQRIVIERAIHGAANGPDTLPGGTVESLMNSQQLLYFNRGFDCPASDGVNGSIERCLIAFVDDKSDVAKALERSLRDMFPDVHARPRGQLLARKSGATEGVPYVYLGELRKDVAVIAISNSTAILDEVIKRGEQEWDVRKVAGWETLIRDNNDRCKHLFCVIRLPPLPDDGGQVVMTSWLESGDSFRQRITYSNELLPEVFSGAVIGPFGKIKDPAKFFNAAGGAYLTADAVFLNARTKEAVIKMGTHERSAVSAAIGIMPVP